MKGVISIRGSGEELRVDRAFIEHLLHAGHCVKYFINFFPAASRPLHVTQASLKPSRAQFPLL